MEALPILVVEDDDLVRSFLSRALAGVGGEVEACATGAEARRAVDRRRFGVILLDGLLPDTHGVELARGLLTHPHAMTSGICFVSGSLRRPMPTRAGISALPKPLRLRELVEPVEELLAWATRGGGAPATARTEALDALAADLLVA
jgi:two-component system OmpR family response regulator